MKYLLSLYDKFWKWLENKFIYKILDRFSRDNCALLAAGIAYYAMFSIFPTIIVAFAIFGVYLKRQDIFQNILSYITTLLPQSKVIIKENLHILITSSKLNTIIGIVGLMWSSNKIFCAVENALHIIWNIKEGRQFLIHKARATFLVLPLITFFYVVIVVTSLIQTLANLQIPIFGIQLTQLPFLFDLLKFVISTLITTSFLYLAYRIIPKTNIRKRFIFYGAVISGFLLEISKLLFYFFLNNIIKSFSIYGSFTALLIMVFWIYLAAQIFLLGGEIAYAFKIRHRERK